MNASRLSVIIAVDASQVAPELDKTAGKINAFSSAVTGAGLGMGAALAGGIASGIASLVSSLGSAVATGFRSAAAFEQVGISLKTMLGSAEAASRVLGDLSDFAAATPFEFPELAKSAKSLIAFGSGAGDVIPELQMLGDLAAGTNKPIGELATLYGKAKVAGTIYAEDINQLLNAGIPVLELLSKQFGVSVTTDRVQTLERRFTAGFERADARAIVKPWQDKMLQQATETARNTRTIAGKAAGKIARIPV